MSPSSSLPPELQLDQFEFPQYTDDATSTFDVNDALLTDYDSPGNCNLNGSPHPHYEEYSDALPYLPPEFKLDLLDANWSPASDSSLISTMASSPSTIWSDRSNPLADMGEWNSMSSEMLGHSGVHPSPTMPETSPEAILAANPYGEMTMVSNLPRYNMKHENSPYTVQAPLCYHDPLYPLPADSAHSSVETALLSPQSLLETMQHHYYHHHMFDREACVSLGSGMPPMTSPFNTASPEQQHIQAQGPSHFTSMSREWDVSAGTAILPMVPQDFPRSFHSANTSTASLTDIPLPFATTHTAAPAQFIPTYTAGVLGASEKALTSPSLPGYGKRKRTDTELLDEVGATKRRRSMGSVQHELLSFWVEQAREGQALGDPSGPTEAVSRSSKDIGTPRACTTCRQKKIKCMKSGEKCQWCQAHGAECVEAHSSRRPTAGSINRRACTACHANKKKCEKVHGGCSECTRRGFTCSYQELQEASKECGEPADPSNSMQGGSGDQGPPASARCLCLTPCSLSYSL
ncbi:hypothetical protein OBBRIDRAFT_795502 [Obba rivulosa]|uniref:Zn(2)-C6 fungal-type domain-containing protein n=1 Tax=Obba rivulosa TaxID=1052685 RepID=A0A8E2DIF8_9APHY|nr:hypothetical protein OBBRIDRAFT_795502 [Obba rivulosa]